MTRWEISGEGRIAASTVCSRGEFCPLLPPVALSRSCSSHAPSWSRRVVQLAVARGGHLAQARRIPRLPRQVIPTFSPCLRADLHCCSASVSLAAARRMQATPHLNPAAVARSTQLATIVRFAPPYRPHSTPLSLLLSETRSPIRRKPWP